MQHPVQNAQRSRRPGQSRNWVRTGTVAVIAVVPLLAIALLATGLFSFPSDLPNTPGGFMVQQTRDFNHSGQLQTAPAAKDMPVEEFMTNWQNTVRTPPSPRI